MPGLFDLFPGMQQQQPENTTGIPGYIEPSPMPVAPMAMLAIGQALSKSLNPTYANAGGGGSGMASQLMQMHQYREQLRHKNAKAKFAHDRWQRQIEYYRQSGNDQMADILEAGGPSVAESVMTERAKQAMDPTHQFKMELLKSLQGGGSSVPGSGGPAPVPAPVQGTPPPVPVAGSQTSPIDRLYGQDVPDAMEREGIARIGTSENIGAAIGDFGDDLRAREKDIREDVQDLTKTNQTNFMKDAEPHLQSIGIARKALRDAKKLFDSSGDRTEEQIITEMSVIAKYIGQMVEPGSVVTANEGRQFTEGSSLFDRAMATLEGWTKGQPLPMNLYIDMLNYINDHGRANVDDLYRIRDNYKYIAGRENIPIDDITFRAGIYGDNNVDIEEFRVRPRTEEEQIQMIKEGPFGNFIGDALDTASNTTDNVANTVTNVFKSTGDQVVDTLAKEFDRFNLDEFDPSTMSDELLNKVNELTPEQFSLLLEYLDPEKEGN